MEASSEDKLKIWDDLLEKQSAIFKETVTRNRELELRNEELERELNVWKTAMREAENENKKLARLLQRNIDDNPVVLCLIDGDGNVFNPDLIAMGNAGGRQAAAMLTKGLTEHLNAAGRIQIWLTIYCNLAGLLDTYRKNTNITVEQYAAFIIGFNGSSPLFSVVDVGPVKEGADSKLKESLRVFTRFPQIAKVFFGGGHDNGYATTLSYLETEGLLHKIILLRGYEEIAYEFRNLNMPDIEVPGVFITHKMQSLHRNQVVGYMNPVQSQDFDRFRTPPLNAPQPRSSSPVEKQKFIDPSQALYKQKPPPCNFFYLSECPQGARCKYGHDYYLSVDQLDELRRSAKRWPCSVANKGAVCPYGDSCIMAHYCSRGAKCTFLKQGKCKFTAKDMHAYAPLNNWNPQHRKHQSSQNSVDEGSEDLQEATF